MARKENDEVSDLTKFMKKLNTEDKVEEDEDSEFLGLKGLNPNLLLYRVCREGENLDWDILAKAKDKESEQITRVNQHINCGSKKASRFISTTTSPDVAREWAFYAKEDAKKGEKAKERQTPRRIIIISLSKIQREQESTLINLTDEKVREHFVSGATQINRVKSSKEVIFQWKIPKAMFYEWKNPGKPPQPK